MVEIKAAIVFEEISRIQKNTKDAHQMKNLNLSCGMVLWCHAFITYTFVSIILYGMEVPDSRCLQNILLRTYWRECVTAKQI